MDGFDECGDLCEIAGRSGILAAHVIADAAGELEGIVSVGPYIGEAGLLQQAGMLAKAGFERVEIFKEPIDGVIPPSGCFTLDYRNDTLWRSERAFGRIEILVREHQHCFSVPVGAPGNAKKVELSHPGLSPSAFEDGLSGDELGGNVGCFLCGRIDGAGESDLLLRRHQESFLIYSPLSLKSLSLFTNDAGRMG